MIPVDFEGTTVEAREGESLAAALTAAGIRIFRTTRSGAERGIFCGMGVCQDCLVEVDGQPNQRACMTAVKAPMRVRRESDSRALTARPATPLPHPATPSARRSTPFTSLDEIPVATPEVLVVGAGPGGLAAAIAARRAGAEVLIVDERSRPGGQYFKQLSVDQFPLADKQHRAGRALIDTALQLGVTITSGVAVWGAFPSLTLPATTPDGPVIYRPKRLIVATGAYERGVPLPGWTLPGVMTTGAAQTLWRTARRLPGRRVLIAGNGPLNLQLAAELLAGGVDIAAVVEAAERPGFGSARELAGMALAAPDLLLDGLRYRTRLLAAGVPLTHGSVIAAIDKAADNLLVRLRATPPGTVPGRTFEVDAVCLGYGFEPSNELLRAAGAAQDVDPVRGGLLTRLDADGRTTLDGVFALGDCTGLGGARAALAAGTIAGLAAAAELGHPMQSLDAKLARARRQLARARRFQDALWSLYRTPRLGLSLADRATPICRCEEVTAGAIEDALFEGHGTAGDVKRRTRAGMGRCQGRYCGPLINEAVALHRGGQPDEYSGFAPRMPFKPVAIEDLLPGEPP